MPKYSKLLRRGGRYYLNARVPKDLIPYYGNKEIIRRALGTSDLREAKSIVAFEAFKLDSDFAAKRREIEAVIPPPTIGTLSDREAHEMVFRWFVAREKVSEDWYFETGCKLDAPDTEEVLDNLRTDEAVFSGGTKDYEAADGRRDLDLFLNAEGLNCPKDSSAYAKLVRLFTKARLENLRRDIARLNGGTATAVEPLFNKLFAHTLMASPRKPVSVEEMVHRFLKALRDGKRSEGTLRTYEVPCRLLKEALGEKTSAASVTKEQITQLFDLLRKAPSNATKRYRRLTLEQAVEMADKRGDPHRLSDKTLENYYNNIVAIFHFAEEQDFIAKNPAKDRWLRASFERRGVPSKKSLFTVVQLNRLFRESPFIPTAGNGEGWLLRDGKAWIALLSLFHGFRSNEACQLYTEDVKTELGITFIEVREEREDGTFSEKKLKGRQSKRRVPLHSEVLKLGFMSFVEERRKDLVNSRLFSDVKCGKRGNYSDAYGKWFGRFVKAKLGEDCKATFHSFRHMFRDALAEAGVPIPDVERLGGWELMNRSSERDYGHGPSLKRLRQQIEKVKFTGLDTKHLYFR